MNTFSVFKIATPSAQTIVTRRHNMGGAAIVWTDGSCDPNPGGPGGWGYRIEYCGAVNEGFGGEKSSTNNRMEMLAIIRGIEAAPVDAPLIVRTDSQLCVLCATGRWAKKKNTDLWAEMRKVIGQRRVVFEWWRGHCGTYGNERADELAGKGRAQALDGPHESAEDIALIRSIAFA